MTCEKCLCPHCIRNVNCMDDKNEDKSQIEPCFNCDECGITKGCVKKLECEEYRISNDYAMRKRKQLKVLRKKV